MMFGQKVLFLISIPRILTMSIQNTTNDVEDLKFVRKELENLKSNMENLTAKLERVTHRQQTTMFFVKLSPDTTLNKNSIVKFDTVVVDEGNNFNAGDGIFVAPVSGIYQFSWTQFVYANKDMDTELRVDNVVVDSMYGYIGTSSEMPATKVVIYKVKKGDHVWIQTSRHDSENIFGTPHDSRSSFMGILLHEI